MRKVDRKVKMMPGPAENKAMPDLGAKEGAENGGKKNPAGGKRVNNS